MSERSSNPLKIEKSHRFIDLCDSVCGVRGHPRGIKTLPHTLNFHSQLVFDMFASILSLIPTTELSFLPESEKSHRYARIDFHIRIFTNDPRKVGLRAPEWSFFIPFDNIDQYQLTGMMRAHATVCNMLQF